MATPASPPRRITRSSLARLAYGKRNATSSAGGATDAPSPDIEDAIPNTASRKRKRATTTAVASASSSRKIKVENEEEAIEEKFKPKAKPPKRQRKPARKTIDPSTGTTAVAPPSDWEATYAAVQRMRAPGGAASSAPVDTMGCERLADRAASPRDQRFQTLVALMLSSQTKDTVNAAAMRNLQTSLPPHSPGAPPGLNLENVLAVAPEALNALIRAVGFHNNKTRYLKAAAPILRDRWAGDIPDTLAGLVALPGVGPKMAHLCLSAAWGRTEGIGVDVHVHRITNLWRWHATRGPEGTRAALEAWLPRDRWREINGLLVGLGQAVCLPVGRRCGDCEVGLLGLCPAADRKKVLEGRRRREGEGKKEEEVTAAAAAATMAKIEVGEDAGEEVKVKVEVEVEVEVKEEVDRERLVEKEDVAVNGQQVKKEEGDEDEKEGLERKLEGS